MKRAGSTGGFTLLEMGIVLFILVMLAGIAIPRMSGLIAEERLRRDAAELLLFVRTARRLAVSENRPYAIRFYEHAFLLEPYITGEQRNHGVVQRHELTLDANYSLERWGDKKFGTPAKQSWIFQADGICEPIRVHFQSEKGWIEFSFNPLTARTEEETYYFP